jgi:uncharacterized delta-60 repeat protein
MRFNTAVPTVHPLEPRRLLAVAATQLDPTFGEGGALVMDLSRYDDLSDLLVQPDGKVVAVSNVSAPVGQPNVLVTRHLPDGTPDPSFGEGGRAGVVTGEFGGGVGAIALAPDGKLVLAGSRRLPREPADDRGFVHVHSDILVLRLHSDGTPDAAFGDSGRVEFEFADGGADDQAADVAVDAEGRLVVAGYSDDPTAVLRTTHDVIPRAFALARLTPAGRLDETFGDNGTVSPGFEPIQLSADTLLLQPDGKILLAGNSFHPADGLNTISRFLLARYNADGTADRSFGGGDGMVVSDVDGVGSRLTGAVLRPDGRIVAVGVTTIYPHIGSDNDFALAAFHPDGAPDTSLGVNGAALADPGAFTCTAADAVLGPDGAVYATGSVSELNAAGAATDARTVLLRLDASGTVRLSAFEASADAGDHDAGAALAFAPDGKLLIGGDVRRDWGDGPHPAVAPPSDLMLARIAVPDQGAVVDFRPGTIRNTGDEPQPQSITVDGTDGDDIITVRAEPTAMDVAPPQVNLVVTVNGERRTYTNWDAAVRTVAVRGGAGDDSIVVLNDPTGVGYVAGRGTVPELLSGPLVAVTLDGGAGNDVLRAAPRDTVSGADTGYTLLGGDGNDLLVGSPGNDKIDAGPGPGRDRVFGRGGNDSVVRDGGRSFAAGGASMHLGRNGVLTILGSAGSDTISINLASDPGDGRPLEVTLNGHARTFRPDHFGALPVSRVAVFSRGGDEFVTVGADVPLPAFLHGGAGNDTLTGGAGDDVLLGGPGNDLLNGMGGNNRVVQGPGKATPLVRLHI